MGKKRYLHTWPEAKKLCRLNQDDIAMAKKLGFGPDSLIRGRPDPKQKWKLPVKDWIRELYRGRFGHVVGDCTPLPEPKPEEPVYDAEAARLYEERLCWDDYFDRNETRPAVELTDDDVPSSGSRVWANR